MIIPPHRASACSTLLAKESGTPFSSGAGTGIGCSPWAPAVGNLQTIGRSKRAAAPRGWGLEEGDGRIVCNFIRATVD